jgi:hypothetical protein
MVLMTVQKHVTSCYEFCAVVCGLCQGIPLIDWQASQVAFIVLSWGTLNIQFSLGQEEHGRCVPYAYIDHQRLGNMSCPPAGGHHVHVHATQQCIHCNCGQQQCKRGVLLQIHGGGELERLRPFFVILLQRSIEQSRCSSVASIGGQLPPQGEQMMKTC